MKQLNDSNSYVSYEEYILCPQKYNNVLKDESFGLDKKKYNNKLLLHSKYYYKMLSFKEEIIRSRFIEAKLKDSSFIPELGIYRHNNVFCNYDYVVYRISEKWGKKYPAFSRDLISYVRNRTNKILLKYFFSFERELNN